MRRSKSIITERLERQNQEIEEVMKRKILGDDRKSSSASVQESHQIVNPVKRQPSSCHQATVNHNAHRDMAWTSLVQPPVGPYQLMTPGMYAHPLIGVPSATPDELDGGYVFCDCPIDSETPKNVLRAGIADYLLATRSEYQPERARYFPTDSDVIIEAKNCCPALRFDDLFNLPDIHEAYKGHPDYPFIERLACLNTPFLRVASCYDLRNSLDDEQAMHGKAKQLLSSSGVNDINPYTVNAESLTNLEGRYRIGHYAKRPFDGENVIHDSGGQAYSCKLVQDKMVYIPLRSITRSGTNYIRPATLPYSNYYLIGLAKLERTDVKTIVLTSNPIEVTLNADNPAIAVVSWIGGIHTIERVDWSPLQRKTIYYAWNPATADGNEKKCAELFYEVRAFLTQMECSLILLERTASSLWQMPMPSTATISFTLPQSACNYSACQLEPKHNPNPNIYKEIQQ